MSSVRLRGATYSAQAVSIALDMNEDRTGIFITSGKLLAIGTTTMEIRGSPISVKSVVFILEMFSVSCPAMLYQVNLTKEGQV